MTLLGEKSRLQISLSDDVLSLKLFIVSVGQAHRGSFQFCLHLSVTEEINKECQSQTVLLSSANLSNVKKWQRVRRRKV